MRVKSRDALISSLESTKSSSVKPSVLPNRTIRTQIRSSLNRMAKVDITRRIKIAKGQLQDANRFRK